MCRSVWRKNANSYAWIITNKNDFYNDEIKNEMSKYIANPRQMNSCTIVHTCRGKYVEETTPLINNIIYYLNVHLNVTFAEFIADFIKDEAGIWWLINVKGFILEPLRHTLNLKVITHAGEEVASEIQLGSSVKMKRTLYDQCNKMKMCRYCEDMFPEAELD